MSEYWTDFAQESDEQITELNNSLLTLERDPDDDDAMEAIFRTAHTLKGNCGAMGLARASDLAHAIEEVLDAVRRDDLEITPEVMDAIFDGVDELEAMLEEAPPNGEIDRDPAAEIETLRSFLDGSTTRTSEDVSTPTDAEIDDILARFDPPQDADHDAFLVRLAITDDPRVNNGQLVVEALVDAFDLVGTAPSREAIENGEYGTAFDAVFGSAVGKDAISAALEPVVAVDAFEIVEVTDRLVSSSDTPGLGANAVDAVDESLTADDVEGLSSTDAQNLSVDELLEEFDEFDDLDAMVEEVEGEDLDAFDEMGDAGSFDDLLGESASADAPPEGDADDSEAESGPTDRAIAAESADAESASGGGVDDREEVADADDADDADDASAVFAELKNEVEMVGFDELQDELEELEFDEFDSDDEVDMDELLGDDVDVDDNSFLEVEDEFGAEFDEEFDDVDLGSDAEETSDEGVERTDADSEVAAAKSSDLDDAPVELSSDVGVESDAEAQSDEETETGTETGSTPAGADDSIVPTDDDFEAFAFDDADLDLDADDSAAEQPVEASDTDSLEPRATDAEGADELEEADVAALDGVDFGETDDGTDDSESSFGDDSAVDDSGTDRDVEGVALEDEDLDLEDEEMSLEDDALGLEDEDLDLENDLGLESIDRDEVEDDFAVDFGFDPVDDSALEDEQDVSLDDSALEADVDVDEDHDHDLDGDLETPDDTAFVGDQPAPTAFDVDADADDAYAFEDDGGLEASAMDADDLEDFDDFDTLDDLGDADDLGDPDDLDVEAVDSAPGDGIAAGADASSTAAFGAAENRDGGDATAAESNRVYEDVPTMPIPDVGVPETDEEADSESNAEQAQSIRVDIDQVDTLLNLVEGLVTARVRLRHTIEQDDDPKTLRRELDDLDDITAELQDTVMDVRLVPLETVANRLPRTVRDIARDQDKAVTFETEGESVELDRSILDRIGDPLIHLVRNAVDHGIEAPSVREEVGKPREGTVRLTAERARDRVQIRIHDDGRGLDAEELREAAVDADVLAADEAADLDDDEVYDLVFHPGLSTATEVTDVSGRGVGMDVVKRTIEDLDGTVSVDSDPGEGTTITMELPVTVAIADVLFFEIGGEEFGVPIKAVQDIDDARTVETVDGNPVIPSSDSPVPVVELAERLETPESSDPDDGMVIRIRDDVRSVALHCDVVHGQQEVVIKPFEGFMGGLPGLSGATVRGRGEVVTILDVNTL
ncbi:chemotaxis protein CheA [Natronosalvus rutilus]|uniref:Chemotaxis protein CheA n=1 Tax=Natronosalvus rutilus TaxID=2953753 RepID=A0A9E7SXF2_9EURY|nr:chemotaxis protein CheA [Natronosalvus rutilus]UTF54073.1 Hpt domain-containing protein [Natronosalvus rutilus]